MSGDDGKFCEQWLDEYVKIGGFPESHFIADDRTRVQFLQNIAETVVFRDVIAALENFLFSRSRPRPETYGARRRFAPHVEWKRLSCALSRTPQPWALLAASGALAPFNSPHL